MRRMIVSLALSLTALLVFGLAATGTGHADEADLAGNGWGNGGPAVGG